MWPLLSALLATAGIHSGWVAVPPAERVWALTDLDIGEIVHVEDVQGRTVSGSVAYVSATKFSIVEDQVAFVVPADEVRTVTRQDSLTNGALLGVAVGLAGAALSVEAVCGEGALCGILLTLAVGPAGGGAIGAGIDSLMHATLYSRPDGPHVSLSPTVSPSRVGARLSLSW